MACGLALGLGWAAAAGAVDAGQRAADPAAAARDVVFDLWFRSVVEASGVPGGAYAIVRDQRVARAAGHGRRALDDAGAVDADTVFRIASVSKTFAAQLTAQLVESGALAWSDTWARRLPDLRLSRPDAAERLQLRHLLGQSSGYVANAYDNLIEDGVPLPRILPLFRTLAPLCAPGRCFSYQNILFSQIAPVLEAATGQDYATLVRERLFRPLGMSRATLGLADFMATVNRAAPHMRRDGPWRQVPVQPNYYTLAPASGINASANDLARWLLAQLGAHPEVVSAQAVAMLTTPGVRTPGELRRRGWRGLLDDAHYGLGWRIYRVGDETLHLHSGWVQGYVADIAYAPARGVGLVVLLNGGTNAINEVTTAFWRGELGRAVATRADAQPTAD